MAIKNGTDTPWVYIGGVPALVKNMQDASLTIYRPALATANYDKAIYVSVTDPKMLTLSSSQSYEVATPGIITGSYGTVNFPLLAVEFDSQENLYTTANKNVYKTDFGGVTQTIILTPANLLSSDYTLTTDMRFGPGGVGKNLFMAVGNNYIARVAALDPPNSKTKPSKLSTPGVVSQLDFDENGNIYVAGNANLYTADTSVGNSNAPTFTAISGYSGVGSLVRIRVVKGSGNEYIYIADSTHIWKAVLSGGSLTMGSPVVDLSTHPELSGSTLSSFEVDANGSLYLCLLNNPNGSLFFVESDGSITAYYKDVNILPNTVQKIVWGNSNTLSSGNSCLYLISCNLQSGGAYAAGRIYRMYLNKNGAPYNGRSFFVQ